ncbi:hypothetical protein FOL47_009816 [Perkinsus chesapeaki]|uniref:Uncharacterized protein n=1 Tax=Perkinsus chesapeaki TaxID=330153 RepID=A0A7J6MR31_PERCH|nr:hypothetical protein FOL47_009816 [Perkinsus chesapeaki]
MSAIRHRREVFGKVASEFSTSPPSSWHDARESDLENFSPLPSNRLRETVLPTARPRRQSYGIGQHCIVADEELSTRLSSRSSPLSFSQSLGKSTTGRFRESRLSDEGLGVNPGDALKECHDEVEAEREPEDSTALELPGDMFRPVHALDMGAGTGGVPWLSPARRRQRTAGRISSTSSGGPITTWGMLRTPGATGHRIVRLNDEDRDDSDSDIHNDSEEEEVPNEKPSPDKPIQSTLLPPSTPEMKHVDTAAENDNKSDSEARQVNVRRTTTDQSKSQPVGQVVKAAAEEARQSAYTDLGGSQRSNVVIRRWITPPTRAVRSQTLQSNFTTMTPPVLFPQYRLFSPIAPQAPTYAFTPPTGLASRPAPLQITQSVPLRRYQSPVRFRNKYDNKTWDS